MPAAAYPASPGAAAAAANVVVAGDPCIPPISPNRQRTLSLSLADPRKLTHGERPERARAQRRAQSSSYEPLALCSPLQGAAFQFPATPMGMSMQMLPVMILATPPAAAMGGCMISPQGGLLLQGGWPQPQLQLMQSQQLQQLQQQQMLFGGDSYRRQYQSLLSPQPPQPQTTWWESDWQG